MLFYLVHLALCSFSPILSTLILYDSFFTTSSIWMNLSAPSRIWKVRLVSKVLCCTNQDLLLIGAHGSDIKRYCSGHPSGLDALSPRKCSVLDGLLLSPSDHLQCSFS